MGKGETAKFMAKEKERKGGKDERKTKVLMWSAAPQ